METETYKQFIATEIRQKAIALRRAGHLTSKGEKMSLAAIGRTLDPPVTRTSVYDVVDGRTQSDRIKRAIEHELGCPYWISKKRTGTK